MSLEAVIAAHRFGLGPRPDELAALAADPRGALIRQLAAPPSPVQSDAGLLTTAQLVEMWQESLTEAKIDKPHAIAAQVPLRAIRDNEQVARFKRSVETRQPFRERLVQFWANHFAVGTAIVKVIAFAGVYEREAIAPHVTGKFYDLLRAAELHPAMLFYLDQSSAMGPDSLTGERMKHGSNENLAREIMELHTLGVDGGYDQADVQALAAVLTGWHVAVENNGRYGFFPDFHEPGPKTLLGTTIPGGGEDETEAAFRLLAAHPSTARHIATKLVRHFIADDPAPEMVAAIARIFLKTGGDLAAVSAGLVNLKQPWLDPMSKIKTPWELVVALGRACADSAEFPDDKTIMVYLKRLGEEPYAPISPAGYPDKAVNWLAGEALLIRINLIRAVAAVAVPKTDIQGLLDSTIAAAARPETVALVTQAPTRQNAMALLFASSEFQRR
jgi:uncharacterized protein (DUF1800 family)